MLLTMASFASAGQYQPSSNVAAYYDDGGCVPPKSTKGKPSSYNPRTWGDLQTKTSGISAAIADGKMDKASESLDGLFTGAGSKAKGSESSAVAVGAWTVEPRTDTGLSKFHFAPRGSEGRPLVERLDGNHEARIITVGASGAAAGLAGAAGSWAVGKVLDKAVDAVKQHNDADKANEKSYEDGTAAWKRDQANKK